MPNGGDTGERQLLTITLLVAGAAVIGLGVFVYFGLSKLGGLKNDSDRLIKQYTMQKQAIRDMRNIDKINTLLKSRIEQYAKFIVKENELSDVIEDIIERALQVGLNLVNYRPVKAPTSNQNSEEPYEKVIYEFQFTGSFHQIIKFLNEIEDTEALGRLILVQPDTIVAAENGLVPGVESTEGHKFKVRLMLYKKHMEQ